MDRTIQLITWLFSASIEKINEIEKEVKKTNFTNDVLINKALKHLLVSKKILIQTERIYNNLLKNGGLKPSSILEIKNTYLQRCLFQRALGQSILEETKTNNIKIKLKWVKLNELIKMLLVQMEILFKKISK